MAELLKRLWKEEEGSGMTEYALVLTFIALATIAAMNSLGSVVFDSYSSVVLQLTGTSIH